MTGAIARSRPDSQVSNLSPIANSFSLSKPLLFSASLVACLASQAFAQPIEDEKYIGIGARVRPAYEGADSSRGEIIPYLRLYGDHLFARTTQGMLEGG